VTRGIVEHLAALELVRQAVEPLRFRDRQFMRLFRWEGWTEDLYCLMPAERERTVVFAVGLGDATFRDGPSFGDACDRSEAMSSGFPGGRAFVVLGMLSEGSLPNQHFILVPEMYVETQFFELDGDFPNALVEHVTKETKRILKTNSAYFRRMK